MSATDELRRLLDEHGIEHHDGEIMTYTDDADFMPSASNTFDVTLYNLTPEQAVEATLGRGTCRLLDGRYGYPFVCSECHAEFSVDFLCGRLRYCPNCGRRVVGA